MPELATIVNHGLPIKIIVMNNGYLGMVRQWQELFYNNRLSSVRWTLSRKRKCLPARTDSRGARSKSRSELRAALEEAVLSPVRIC